MKNARSTLVAAIALLTSCTTTTTEAIIGGPSLPGLPDATFRIVGRVSGEGSATTISPAFLSIFGAPTSEEIATETAVGNAIFDRDDVDLVTAPKSKVTTISFLGLWSHSKVHIKGQGLKVEQPRN
jgi:hypothetical protein